MITLLILALVVSPAMSNRWSRQLPQGQINNGDWIPVSQPCPTCRQQGSRVLNYPLQQPPTFFPHPIFSPAQQPFSLFGEPFALQPQYSPISAQQFVPQAQKPHNIPHIVPQPLIQHQNNQPISQQQMNFKQLPKEEKEEVQLLYVPLETLRQRGKLQNAPGVNSGGVNEFYRQPTISPQPITTTRISTTVKPKQKPHQPALAMFMSKHDDKVGVSDVLTLLKDAKSIPVLDNLGSQSPEVFVGPSQLKVPDNYVRFDLPYLSSIEHNRVERKVEDYPFFVAPLSYKAPEGYSKIPFPAPHVGSIVVKPPQIAQATPAPPVQSFFSTETPSQRNFVPLSHAAYVTPLAQTDLPINNQQNQGHFVTHGVQQFSTARPIQNLQNTQNFVQNTELKQQNYNNQQQYNNPQQQFIQNENPTPKPTQTIETQRQQQYYRPHTTTKQQQTELPRFAQEEEQHLRSTQKPPSISSHAQDHQDQHNYQTTIPELVNANLPHFVQYEPIHEISSTSKPVPSEDYSSNGYYTQTQQVSQQRGNLIRQQQEDQLVHHQQNNNQFRNQEEDNLLRKQAEETRARREEEEKLLQRQQEAQLLRQQQEEQILRQQQEEQIIRQQKEEQLLRQQEEERILRQKQEEQARVEEDRKLRQQQEELKRIKEQEERKIRQRQLEERQQRERMRQQELRQRQKLQQQKKQEQELLQQEQEQQKYLQDQLSFEEELEIRKQVPEEPQYIQLKELTHVSSTVKPTTKEQEEFEMKQYFKQQSAFKSLPQSPEYQQQTPVYATETEATIESSTPLYSLPSELPAINAHLPGLINSLQDGTRHFNLELGTVSTTTSAPPSTSTYFTRRPQTRGRRPVPTRASTVADYTTRRTTRGRRPYTASRYTPRPVVKPESQQTVQEKPQQQEEVSVFVSSPLPSVHEASPTEQPLRTTTAPRAHSRYQNRYNYNNDDSSDSQRKSQVRQRFRTRGRPQYTTKKPEEENYPKLPVVAVTEENRIPEVLNLEMVKEPVKDYYPTQSPLDSYIDLTTAIYDNVSKYEHITVITPSSTEALQYTRPQENREQVSEYYVSPSIQTQDDISDNNLRKEMKVQDETFVEDPVKNEEDYGFTRIPNFPPIVMQTPEQRHQIQNSPNVHPVYVPTETHTTEETREVEHPKIRKNHFFRRPSRPITTTSNPLTTNYPTTEVVRRGRYTVRPTRKPESTNLPKIMKIRGRIRKPTTAATTTEKVDPSNEVEFDQVPTPRPTHRYISKIRTSEASADEDQTEASNSAFRITVDPDDQYTYESIRRPHYLNLDVQESQWSPKLSHNSFQPYVPRGKGERALHNKDPAEKEVEIVTSGRDLSEILTQEPLEDEDNFMITVTPSISLTSEEETLLGNEQKDPTVEPTLAGMVVNKIMEKIEEMAEKKDTETDMTKKSTDPLADKKASGRKRGNWRLVRKRPVDNLEAAESQNFRNTYINSVEAVDRKISSTPETPGDIDLGTGSPIVFSTTRNTTVEETTLQPEVTSVNPEVTTNAEEKDAEEELTTLSNVNITDIPITTENPDTIDSEDHSEVISTEVDTTLSPIIKEIGGLIEEAIVKIAGAENIYEESIEPTEATSSTSTELPSNGLLDSMVLATSTSTEISHETEICYRGRCVKTDTDLEMDQK